MKKLIALAILVAVGVAGCASAPAKKTVNPNITACKSFEATFEKLSQASADRNDNTISVAKWQEVEATASDEYSKSSLMAKGDVKRLIDSLIDTIDAAPDGMRDYLIVEGPLSTAGSRLYYSKLKRVGAACTKQGFKMSFSTGS